MKKQINDLLLKMQNGENCIGETANQLLDLFDVSGSVFILIDGNGDNIAYIIKDEKELEHWKSDGSTEKGDKLYKAVFVEQF